MNSKISVIDEKACTGCTSNKVDAPDVLFFLIGWFGVGVSLEIND